MKFQSFREIIAWQKAKEMTVGIYKVFGTHKDFGFRDQIQRAAVSVCNNISEGYGRNTNKEFIRFLEISKGSLYEVQNLLDIGKDLGYLTNDEYIKLDGQCVEILKITYGLIQKLQTFV
ncbi:MAG: four helix bundle protein [bacterium]